VYGPGTVEVKVRDSYFNMREIVDGRMDIVQRALDAYRAIGVTPIISPIRGGTDGAKLTFKGLPCPNIATGGMNFHGRFECVAVEDMDKMTDMLVQLVTEE
jgi:tripeptide aminopeptidase